jgi:hypothetical protein
MACRVHSYTFVHSGKVTPSKGIAVTLLTLVARWFGLRFAHVEPASSSALVIHEHYEEDDYHHDDGAPEDEFDLDFGSIDDEDKSNGQLGPQLRMSKFFAASYEEEAAYLLDANELLDAAE